MSSARAPADQTSRGNDATRIDQLAEHFDATDASDLPWVEAEEVEILKSDLEGVSLGLPREDIAELKRRATLAGVQYTTLIRMILRQHLRNPLTR